MQQTDGHVGRCITVSNSGGPAPIQLLCLSNYCSRGRAKKSARYVSRDQNFTLYVALRDKNMYERVMVAQNPLISSLCPFHSIAFPFVRSVGFDKSFSLSPFTFLYFFFRSSYSTEKICISKKKKNFGSQFKRNPRPSIQWWYRYTYTYTRILYV